MSYLVRCSCHGCMQTFAHQNPKHSGPCPVCQPSEAATERFSQLSSKIAKNQHVNRQVKEEYEYLKSQNFSF